MAALLAQLLSRAAAARQNSGRSAWGRERLAQLETGLPWLVRLAWLIACSHVLRTFARNRDTTRHWHLFSGLGSYHVEPGIRGPLELPLIMCLVLCVRGCLCVCTLLCSHQCVCVWAFLFFSAS